MSGMGQIFIGGAAIVAAASLAIQSFAPSAVGVQVHDLACSDGVIVQEITVTGTDGVSFSFRAASVADTSDGLVVHGCDGAPGPLVMLPRGEAANAE